MYLPHAINPQFTAANRTKDALITTLHIYSQEISHSRFRDDPFLPAPYPKESAKWRDSFYNTSTKPTLLACIDKTEICEMETCKCSVVTRPSDQDCFLHLQNKTEVATQEDLEFTPLLTALTAFNIAQAAFYPDVKLEAASHCEDPTSILFEQPLLRST